MSIPTKTRSKQQERAERILDAAAELISRWGYDKTTMDDISRKADVAKGTLYLHWKTREDLFEALLRRESLELGKDFKRRILEDPAGATLRGVYKHAALALMKRPLLKAVLLGDQEIIGKLARSEENRTFYARRWAGFAVYLDFLNEHHLIRSDISLPALTYTITAIFAGFFMVAPLVPSELKPSDEEIAGLIGETIHQTIETGQEVPPDELQHLSDAFIAYLEQSLENAETQAQAGRAA